MTPTEKAQQEILEECKHEWKEDEMFKSGTVMMLFGNAKDVMKNLMNCRETRMICRKCGVVDYVKK